MAVRQPVWLVGLLILFVTLETAVYVVSFALFQGTGAEHSGGRSSSATYSPFWSWGPISGAPTVWPEVARVPLGDTGDELEVKTPRRGTPWHAGAPTGACRGRRPGDWSAYPEDRFLGAELRPRAVVASLLPERHAEGATMTYQVRRAEYFYTTVTDEPGQALNLLTLLVEKGINLLAFTAVPVGPNRTQLTIFPDDVAKTVSEAKKAQLRWTGPTPPCWSTARTRSAPWRQSTQSSTRPTSTSTPPAAWPMVGAATAI